MYLSRKSRKLFVESAKAKTDVYKDREPITGMKIPGMDRFFSIMTQDRGISSEEKEEAKKLWIGFSENERHRILGLRSGDKIARYCAIFFC